jgi:uncharacterized protein YabN with tetrapyrrole methylase and pyrophosphatase domain
MKQGKLTIVGTGIKMGRHISVEAQAHIKQADKVFYVGMGSVFAEWIEGLNDTAESLVSLYQDDKRRLDTYHEMVAHILTAVRQDQKVCAVFYGHPGVFVVPSHAAIVQARAEGYTAQMLPGISAEDCLFADLGIDPAVHGCQTFEATDFLLRHRQFDPASSLVIWQIGVVGEVRKHDRNREGLKLLTTELLNHYPPDHQVIVYQAAMYPIDRPIIHPVRLADLPKAPMSTVSTLYVPPCEQTPIDVEMLAKLGLQLSDIERDW